MRPNTRQLVIVLSALFLIPSAAQGIVRELSADISSNIQEFVNDAAESSDQATENSGVGGLEPPIQTRANLETLDDVGNTVARAIAVSEFRDPTEGGGGRNPEEISVEADCFSNDATTRYDLDSTVTETRIVVLSASELNNPIGSRTVRSIFTASGAIFAWSLDADRDLTGLSGQLSIAVRRIDADGIETTLVDESVAITGGPDGGFTGQNSSGLLVFFGDLDILPDTGEAGFGDVNLDAIAASRVGIILQQNINYEYDAVADEEFTLVATVTTSVSNLPDGTGVVAVFGRPFDDVLEIIEIGIPADSARVLEARLNKAITDFKAADPPLSANTTSPLCGVLGFEMIPMLMGGFMLCGTSRRIIRAQRPNRRADS